MGFDSRRTAVYPGLALECRTFVNPDYIQIGDGGPHHSPLKKRVCGRVMCLIDTPFSATIDTLCLPFDIYHAIPNRQAHQPTESAADTACIKKENCAHKESLNNTQPSGPPNNTGHLVQRTILQTDTQSTPEGIWNQMKAGCMIPVACSTLIHNSARAYVEDYDKSKSLVYNGEKLIALKYRIALYLNEKELKELKKTFRVDFITQYDMQDKKWIGISPDSFFTEYNQRNRN